MVRLARVLSDADDVPAGLETLAASSELDWLQLDYARPLTAIPEGPAPPRLPTFAGGFVEALRLLGKSLFLEPQLRVVASAGWDDAYRCVESSAAALVAAGCGEMPVAAVRGSNLLPVLEMLVASGVDLADVKTGAPWRELRQPILAADLRVGAGPLAKAMEEGARVVVAGSFDDAAPLTAAAVCGFQWGWHDWQQLAGASLAAAAAAWTDWFLEAPHEESIEAEQAPATRWVELHADGTSIVDVGRGVSELIAASVRDSLERTLADGGCSADVRPASFQMDATSEGQLRMAPKEASPADRCWDLVILYQVGFAAEGLLEFSAQANPNARRQIAAAAARRLVVAGDATAAASVESLGSQSAEDGRSWLHLACQSKSRAACQQFADRAARLAAAHPRLVRFVSGRPSVHAHLGRWKARVPRDAVDIAVETRPAREWQ